MALSSPIRVFGLLKRRQWSVGVGLLSVATGVAIWTIATFVFPHYSLNHDEAVYIQQASMLLEGQLSLWPPLEDVFRPWFFIEDGSRLYPKYTPVVAALFATGKLFGGFHLALIVVAMGNVILCAHLCRDLFDEAHGIIAACLLFASPLFLIQSSVFLPYAPTMLLNLLFAVSYFRADQTGDHRWGLLAGSAIGLAFFARPFTAIVFAIPFLIHAGWRIYHRWPEWNLPQVSTGIAGSLGVVVALGYNHVMTGSVFLFPYEAFAPLDGIGFGTRRLLGHELVYTPKLAIRANALVLEAFALEWFVGGIAGVALAAIGVGLLLRSGVDHRQAVMLGLLVAIPLGNLSFWGSYNILGSLPHRGDGLISVLGPYYHIDLLISLTLVASVGLLGVCRWLVSILGSQQLLELAPRLAVGIVIVVSVIALGWATAGAIDGPLERNQQITATYDTAYAPFEPKNLSQSVVIVPTPYGDWLNHPFQPLQNDPDFDGETLYALEGRPFAVAETYPDRTLYRYGYRGPWVPQHGSPGQASLQHVAVEAGHSVSVTTEMGISEHASGSTIRVSSGNTTRYFVANRTRTAMALTFRIDPDQVTVGGNVTPTTTSTLPLDETGKISTTVFVDYGGGDGYSYTIEVPVSTENETVTVMTPALGYCRGLGRCPEQAMYIEEAAPPGISLETSIRSDEPN